MFSPCEDIFELSADTRASRAPEREEEVRTLLAAWGKMGGDARREAAQSVSEEILRILSAK